MDSTSVRRPAFPSSSPPLQPAQPHPAEEPGIWGGAARTRLRSHAPPQIPADFLGAQQTALGLRRARVADKYSRSMGYGSPYAAMQPRHTQYSEVFRGLRQLAGLAALLAILFLTGCTRQAVIRLTATPDSGQPAAATSETPAAASGRQSAAASSQTPPAVPGEPADPRSSRVGEVVQDVQARASSLESFTPAAAGLTLLPGGEVRTGAESSVRLDLAAGAQVRLGPGTAVYVQGINLLSEGLLVRLRLSDGKLWGGQPESTLRVETPLGTAAGRRGFLAVTYSTNNTPETTDDLLVADCLAGACSIRSQDPPLAADLGSGERGVVNAGGLVRAPLAEGDLADFLLHNPEVQRAGLEAAQTAAPPLPTQTPSATPEPSATPTALPPTPTRAPSATPPPAASPTVAAGAILGTHTVRAGETLFCIGRGYRVLPSAISAANGGVTRIITGQVLQIPNVPWVDVPSGPTCATQFPVP